MQAPRQAESGIVLALRLAARARSTSVRSSDDRAQQRRIPVREAVLARSAEVSVRAIRTQRPRDLEVSTPGVRLADAGDVAARDEAARCRPISADLHALVVED